MSRSMPSGAVGPGADDFYGLRDVAYHRLIGLRFERPDPLGPATVTLPARPDLLDPDGRQSFAALFSVGEVACGLAICDAVVSQFDEAGAAKVPIALTTRASLTPAARPHGEVRTRAALVDDADAATAMLRKGRKVSLRVECALLAGDASVGRIRVDFYVRLIDSRRLRAMASQLTPPLAARAQAMLAHHTRGEAT